jgi:hypothetical protein
MKKAASILLTSAALLMFAPAAHADMGAGGGGVDNDMDGLFGGGGGVLILCPPGGGRGVNIMGAGGGDCPAIGDLLPGIVAPAGGATVDQPSGDAIINAIAALIDAGIGAQP